MTQQEMIVLLDQLSREEIKQFLAMCIYQLEKPDIKEVLDEQIRDDLKAELAGMWICI